MELLLLAMLYSSKTTSSAQLNLLGLILLLSIVFCFFYFWFCFCFCFKSLHSRLMIDPCFFFKKTHVSVLEYAVSPHWAPERGGGGCCYYTVVSFGYFITPWGWQPFFFFGLRQPNGLLTGLACIPWRFPYKYVTISGLRKQISHTENSESECL